MIVVFIFFQLIASLQMQTFKKCIIQNNIYVLTYLIISDLKFDRM